MGRRLQVPPGLKRLYHRLTLTILLLNFNQVAIRAYNNTLA